MLGGHCRAMEGRAVSVFARGRVLYLFLLLPVFLIVLAEGKFNPQPHLVQAPRQPSGARRLMPRATHRSQRQGSWQPPLAPRV